MIAVGWFLCGSLRPGVSTKHPKVHVGVELLCVLMCRRVSSNYQTGLRVDSTRSCGDPEEFRVKAVRLASSFPDRTVRQLAPELGISEQRDSTQPGQAGTPIDRGELLGPELRLHPTRTVHLLCVLRLQNGSSFGCKSPLRKALVEPVS
jgi:hypothetical protein